MIVTQTSSVILELLLEYDYKPLITSFLHELLFQPPAGILRTASVLLGSRPVLQHCTVAL